MKSYVLDANALLLYLEGRPAAAAVRKLFEQAEAGRADLAMSVMNWGEVFYILRKTRDREAARNLLSPFRRSLRLFLADRECAERAAELKARHKLGYADAIAADLAITLKGTLVSADPEFEKLGSHLSLRILPRHH